MLVARTPAGLRLYTQELVCAFIPHSLREWQGEAFIRRVEKIKGPASAVISVVLEDGKVARLHASGCKISAVISTKLRQLVESNFVQGSELLASIGSPVVPKSNKDIREAYALLLGAYCPY